MVCHSECSYVLLQKYRPFRALTQRQRDHFIAVLAYRWQIVEGSFSAVSKPILQLEVLILHGMFKIYMCARVYRIFSRFLFARPTFAPFFHWELVFFQASPFGIPTFCTAQSSTCYQNVDVTNGFLWHICTSWRLQNPTNEISWNMFFYKFANLIQFKRIQVRVNDLITRKK